ncbi:hypothetical protein [Pseudomonas sp. A-R-26]|uniref:hypothetical protein n=1 Tax=Pseudomonas sp. A-R-26 TaxID=2832404 RepID=UPI001CBE43AF|nr:hypothetical protein [Pseudomonas sp. A-R-26]
MSNVDAFTRGLTQAVARRTKQQSAQQTQKVDSGVSNATTTTNTNTTIQQSSDEQYQATIIEKMINHIRQKGINK